MIGVETLLSLVQKLNFYFSMCFCLLCMIGIWIGKRSVVVQSKKVRMRFIVYIYCLPVYIAKVLLVYYSWHQSETCVLTCNLSPFRSIQFVTFPLRLFLYGRLYYQRVSQHQRLHSEVSLHCLSAHPNSSLKLFEILPGLIQLAYSHLHIALDVTYNGISSSFPL